MNIDEIAAGLVESTNKPDILEGINFIGPLWADELASYHHPALPHDGIVSGPEHWEVEIGIYERIKKDMPDVRDHVAAIVARGDVITMVHERMGTTPDGKLFLAIALSEHIVRDGRIVQSDVWYDPETVGPRELPALFPRG